MKTETSLLTRMLTITETLKGSTYSTKRDFVRSVLSVLNPSTPKVFITRSSHHIATGMLDSQSKVQQFVETMIKRLSIEVLEESLSQVMTAKSDYRGY